MMPASGPVVPSGGHWKKASRVLFIAHVFTSFIHLIIVDILVLQVSIQLFYDLKSLGVSCAVRLCLQPLLE